MQAALVATLRADAPVAALVGTRVVDQPEQAIDFPYLRIFDIEASRADTSNTLAAELTISIRVYTRNSASGGFGKVEAWRVLGAVHNALHRNEAALSLTGWRLVELIERTAVVRPDADGASMEGVAVYAALIQPA